jgi:hypothetical protein
MEAFKHCKERGTTRITGLIAIARSALDLSATFIEPSSAVIADPLLPITTTPTNNGPSSRNGVSEARSGT